ncbi:MAG: hypothetical protein P4L33_11410 [Capsulimonadaceae bacterium]|nr:hypothetical protein [Capsulimonadaceae bacterium]
MHADCPSALTIAGACVGTYTEARHDWFWQAIEQIGADMGLGPEILERFWVAEKGGA